LPSKPQSLSKVVLRMSSQKQARTKNRPKLSNRVQPGSLTLHHTWLHAALPPTSRRFKMHSHPNRPPVSVFLRGPMSRKRAASIAVSGVLVLFAFLLTVSINGNTPHAAAQAPNQSGWRPPGIGPSSTTPHEKFATF